MRLAVFDIDGTLIGYNTFTLQNSTVKALKMLKNQGVILSLATARAVNMLDENLLSNIEFDYYICLNGSYAVDKKGKEIFREKMPTEDIEKLLEEMKAKNYAISVHYTREHYAYYGADKLSLLWTVPGEKENIIFPDRTEYNRYKREAAVSATVYVPDNEIDEIRSRYPLFKFVKLQSNFYDVVMKNSGKGVALRKIREQLKIERNETIAFGDGNSDIDMICEAGVGVAMGNAVPELKEAADYITKEVTDDGIYYALKNLKII